MKAERKDEYNRVKTAGGKVLDFEGKLKARANFQ